MRLINFTKQQNKFAKFKGKTNPKGTKITKKGAEEIRPFFNFYHAQQNTFSYFIFFICTFSTFAMKMDHESPEEHLCITECIKYQIIKLEKNPNNHSPYRIKKDSISETIRKKEKILSAIFAFPIPFGFVGSHRVLLGTKPWVPIVYVATLGGAFGLIPLIDFVAIVINKEEQKYKNHPGVFMWVK